MITNLRFKKLKGDTEFDIIISKDEATIEQFYEEEVVNFDELPNTGEFKTLIIKPLKENSGVFYQRSLVYKYFNYPYDFAGDRETIGDFRVYIRT